ncbi:MAG: hypothetical protein ACU0DW_14435 [Shimia sp.]
MMTPDEITARLKSLRAEMAESYGTKGRTFARQVRQIGREMPRYERKQAKIIIQAERLSGHPKLARQVQPGDLVRAFNAMESHLSTVSRADRVKGKAISILATILFNLLLAVAGLAVVWWAFGG